MAEDQGARSPTAGRREVSAGHRVGGSYRDPSGFVFVRDGVLLRQINQTYQKNYELLMSCGLYPELIERSLLIPHEEIDAPPAEAAGAWKVVRPRHVGFISYPFEWTFSQLKDAALATLDIQQRAIRHGMSLKDASAYNIQFDAGKPTLIDTLSFEKYEAEQPWPAYRQFCQHFLAPLALISHVDVRLSQLLSSYLDGIPLDLASKLLPRTTWLRFSLAMHLHLHATFQKKHGSTSEKPAASARMSRHKLEGIIDNLQGAIASLKWKPVGTEWAGYAQDSGYSTAAAAHKRKLVGEFIAAAGPGNVWDLGANDGEFSRLASERGIPTIAFDADPAAAEINYLKMREKGEKNLLPLVMDLIQPSAAIGWNNCERLSLGERGPVDLCLALALVHHLAISGNVPLGHVAEFFGRVGRNIAIEFVPKSDPQVGRLLVVRKDIFENYTQEAFEAEFGRYFEIVRREAIAESQRTLYLMRRREAV